MEKHYTLQKAAALLGVTTQTLRNWDNAGKIRTIRTPGNQRRIPESEIARFTDFAAHDIVPKKPEVTTFELPQIVSDKKDYYLLMCKDTAVYDIKQELVLDESLIPGCLLKGSMSFWQWMETRYGKETNFSSRRLMQRALGHNNQEQAAYATGALSLSDCYWIKKFDEDVLFSDVTPYLNKEWDAMEPTGVQDDYLWGSLSNLFVGGKTDKRWLDAQTLLKVNSFREIEPYLLCAYLGLENITEAHKSDEGIILNNFTSTEVFFESMEQMGIDGENTDFRRTAVEKFKEQAVALFVIDYLVENNDRHADDFGYLRNTAAGEYISMAPFHNFDWIWTGEVTHLPDNARQGYNEYIRDLCRQAISVAREFEYGTIIERRARELM